jgi:hypothetical protein
VFHRRVQVATWQARSVAVAMLDAAASDFRRFNYGIALAHRQRDWRCRTSTAARSIPDILVFAALGLARAVWRRSRPRPT